MFCIFSVIPFCNGVLYSLLCCFFLPSKSINVEKCNDIGLLLWSISQIEIFNLASESKYSLLVNHIKPSSAFKFPSRYLDWCNRSCQHKYLEENPWLVYSKVEDALFCLPCVLFATKELGPFFYMHWF